MKLRMQGRHRDLIALIEFGNEAYVVTPFTTDYQNVLLSIRSSRARGNGSVPRPGHDHHPGHQAGHALFSAFDFLNASGNLMVIFSDGQDTQTLLNGQSIDSIMADALRHKIPVYFIRVAYDKASGAAPARRDLEEGRGAYRRALLRGAPTRATILRAVTRSIVWRRAASTSASTRRGARASRAARRRRGLWLVAAALKLTVPKLRSFP